ncbi:hypothetical protein QTP86_000695 [Hemibagrus guttatus]|nr:hypothetical protein QTP86_000695 [Hemibagrus guttatus]
MMLYYLDGPLQNELGGLLWRFLSLFQQRPGWTELVHHTIHLADATPSRQQPYRIPKRLFNPLKAEIKMMKELGIIIASTSEWSSLLVIVPKKEGFSLCKLNAQSKFDAYPIPRIDDLLEQIGPSTSKHWICARGTGRCPLIRAPDCLPLLGHLLGYTSLQSKPFGLHRVPATFQRLIDKVLQGCEEWKKIKHQWRCSKALRSASGGSEPARSSSSDSAGFRTVLPSIHLANLRSLPNKMDELLLLSRTNKDFSNSAALCFTESWLNDAIPDSALNLPGFQLFRADRVVESAGKSCGGGTCFYINERWCTDVTVLKKMCCPDLEAFFINCKPFYSPKGVFLIHSSGATDLDELTETVTSYISFCEDMCIPTRTYLSFNNDKPWFTSKLRHLRQAKEDAFRNGDRVLYNWARNTLNKEIRVAKRSYAKKLENQFSSNDPASVWKGLKYITNYKTPSPSTETNQQLAEDLNEFYCRFETASLTPHAPSEHLSIQPLTPPLSPPPALRISEDDVRQIFLKQKKRKAPGPDGVTPACLKTCADQLAFIFSQIFNRSLELCEVPACFKRSTIIPIPKKPKITGLLKTTDLSAFNTIIPTLLQTKLTQLSVPSSICQWITSFLTDRHQLVKLGKFKSNSRTTSTGASQGCVLSPLLFSLYTNDCTSTDPSVKLLKFADDTTVIGLIQDGDESAYRQEIEQLAAWCSRNNLELNTLKTVEMIVDFRRNTPAFPLLTIMNSTVPTVASFRFLGTTISQDLKWNTHIDATIKKAQQRLYFLRQLRKFNLPQELLIHFYSAVIESVLCTSITVWFGSATESDMRRLQRMVQTAERIIGASLPTLQELYTSRVRKRALKITLDPSHPGHILFDLLPSSPRYRAANTRTARHKNSFFPKAIYLLNS